MTAVATRESGTEPSSRRGWFAVASVTLGLFAIVTTEILPIGLLVQIRDGFTVSDGMAGLTMTLPGLLAAVAAPLVTVASARVNRRLMLVALIGVLVVANLLAAVATGLWLLLVSRVLVGVVIGGFWSIGAGLAPRLVRARVGLATALIFAAVPLGSVLGVPAGTLIGALLGWRWGFGVLALLSLGVLAALALSLPPLPTRRATDVTTLRNLLSRRATRSGLLVTVLVVVAHFGTYTYVAPLLVDVNGIDATLIGTLLLVYGGSGVAGNFVAGLTLTRAPRLTFAVAAAAVAIATALLPLAGDSLPLTLVALLLWGSAYGAIPAASQTWFGTAAPDAPEAATVVFTASFQAALSGGALLGGLVVDATSPATAMATGAGLAAVAAMTVAGASRRSQRRPGRS